MATSMTSKMEMMVREDGVQVPQELNGCKGTWAKYKDMSLLALTLIKIFGEDTLAICCLMPFHGFC